jgi:hypothetical protein
MTNMGLAVMGYDRPANLEGLARMKTTASIPATPYVNHKVGQVGQVGLSLEISEFRNDRPLTDQSAVGHQAIDRIADQAALVVQTKGLRDGSSPQGAVLRAASARNRSIFLLSALVPNDSTGSNFSEGDYK